MNKRQAKKAHKKVVYPLIDEYNLLTLDEDEYKKAKADFEKYIFQHFRYKHYKDKYKLSRKFCTYVYPVGKAYREKMEQKLQKAKKYKIDTIIVYQSLEDLKKAYPANCYAVLKNGGDKEL